MILTFRESRSDSDSEDTGARLLNGLSGTTQDLSLCVDFMHVTSSFQMRFTGNVCAVNCDAIHHRQNVISIAVFLFMNSEHEHWTVNGKKAMLSKIM